MRTLGIAILALCGFLYAVPADAAVYYEFNPDYAQSLLVASSEQPSEVFLPLNEYLGGFDFWISTGGQSGEATFTLRNAAGAQLAQRTVALPPINDSESGTRFHVNLTSQLAVNGTAAYSISVSSALPTLRLYYATQNRLLAHNDVPVPAYTGGLARLGTEDQGFSFKFALYENSETKAPILSSVGTAQTVIDTVLLSFNADEPVDFRVQYNGTLSDWTGSYTACLPTVEICTRALTVTPDTEYDYTLTVRDVWGNQTVFTGSFVSLGYGQTPTPTPSATATTTPGPSASATPTPPPDTTGPVVTNLRVVNLAPTSAGFAWTTNEAANSTVVVQLTPVFITVGGNSDATLELEHLITVGSLEPDTYYRARITTADSQNNTTTALLTFLTPQNISSTPTPSPGATPTDSPTPTVTAQGSEDAPIVTWSGPASGEPSGGYRVDIFDENNQLIKTIIVPAGTHFIQLTDVPEGQQRIVVYANNDGVFEKVASPTTVRVQKKSLLERLIGYAPYILGGIVLLIGIAVAVIKFRKPKPPVLTGPVSPAPAPVTPPPAPGAAV